MAADAHEGCDSFSAVGPGAIHRRGSRTTPEPSEEPSPVAELRRLGRPAVSVCLYVLDALALNRQDNVQRCKLSFDSLPRPNGITGFPTGYITVCFNICEPSLSIRKHCL